jgi:hypothetical protein
VLVLERSRLTMIDDTIAGNSSSQVGGGIDNLGTLILADDALVDNSARFGGALLNANGSLTIQNVTIAGNRAAVGGGLEISGGTAQIEDATISGNSAKASGGGLWQDNAGSTRRTTLINTIVASNVSGSKPDDIFVLGGGVSGSHNLIGAGGSGGLQNGVDGNLVGIADPGLAPLGNYGGPTQTMAVLPGSPAIDAGLSGRGIPTTDQRGQPRAGGVDIGAFQSQGFTLTLVPGSSPQRARIGTRFADPLTVVVKAKNPIEPVAGGTVIFLAPESGASAVLSPAETVRIDAAGRASVTAVANMIVGEYTVTAVVPWAAPVTFNLINTPAAAGGDVALGGASSLKASPAAATGRFALPASGRTASVAANVVDEVLGDLAGDAATPLDCHLHR